MASRLLESFPRLGELLKFAKQILFPAVRSGTATIQMLKHSPQSNLHGESAAWKALGDTAPGGARLSETKEAPAAGLNKRIRFVRGKTAFSEAAKWLVTVKAWAEARKVNSWKESGTQSNGARTRRMPSKQANSLAVWNTRGKFNPSSW